MEIRFYKSKNHKLIKGVCGGLAESFAFYLDDYLKERRVAFIQFSVIIIRLALILVSIFNRDACILIIAAYCICAVFLQDRPDYRPFEETKNSRVNDDLLKTIKFLNDITVLSGKITSQSIQQITTNVYRVTIDVYKQVVINNEYAPIAREIIDNILPAFIDCLTKYQQVEAMYTSTEQTEAEKQERLKIISNLHNKTILVSREISRQSFDSARALSENTAQLL